MAKSKPEIDGEAPFDHLIADELEAPWAALPYDQESDEAPEGDPGHDCTGESEAS